MLAEFLSKQGEWTQVMPGARACLFSLCERSFPLPLRLEPLHFEVLFCLAGMVTLTRRDGSALRLGTRQVLLLTDISDLTDARVETGVKGVLVAVDAEETRADAVAIAAKLRARGIATEVAPRADRFGKQIRYADRRGIPFVWFSSNEVKDIRSGEQVPADPDSWTPPEGDRRPGVSGG